MRLAGAVLLAAIAPYAFAAGAPAAGLLEFSREETAAILQHGPWPPAPARDASNRVSGSPRASGFGAQLFFDPRLSVTGTVACATCHVPERAWIDGRARARGLEEVDRNTPSVLNARFNRWFGWSGASDSLWAASVRPIADAREMGSAERHVAALLRGDPALACSYREAFGRSPPASDEELVADVGKALAAFQETLVTGRTPFDDFRDALARGDRAAAARYPLAAQRGLRLFVGEGRCNVCHFGPLFTNGEFDKVGIPVRSADGRYDWGRYDGIKTLRAGRFNRLSRHSDDRAGTGAVSTRHVALDIEAYGAFKVPGLRNVALTSPYMHDGSLGTLAEVVRHYSEIDEVKLHIAAHHPHAEPGEPQLPRPAESVLRTLKWSGTQVADVVAFLETLTERRPALRRPPPTRGSCG